ncbi:MAG: flagellar biosynthetic protein FliR [Melioribacteraceae bacterium]|nr:flagellar biosynthetic protein FliR [Melioribacteraceae bacterium]MCF8355143.1 flagellar biosynthetic protein FliR [Melioribacteraceae bacterium]MCF8392472.1 flagellar biosynthetic protein FliR [Melioribacteraceae bacterium]MCF8418383.1 flagellar biosynthetic protein FliR [Melioribacteraceae bacterium]
MIEIAVSNFLFLVLIFLRVSGLVFTAPFLSDSRFPIKAKIGLSIILAYIIFYSMPEIEMPADDSIISIIFIGVKEVLVGLIIGFVMNFIFWGISFAGSLIGFEMGLAMAQAFDSTTEIENNIIGTVLSFLALLIFVLINGHHYLIQSIIYSYKLIPMSGIKLTENFFDLLIKYSAGIFVLAIKISSPLIVSFFLLNIAAGIVSRIIPQMQVFFVLQPLQIGLGLFLLILLIPIYVYFMKNTLELYEFKLMNIIKSIA